MKDMKFRAWEVAGNKMHHFDFWEWLAIGSTYWEHEWAEEKKLKIMQFTGLDAQNGEIYEGDIVRFEYYQPCKGIKDYEVYYREEVAGFEFIELPIKAGQESRESWMPGWDHCAAHGMIIGNIHENKELLKEGGDGRSLE